MHISIVTLLFLSLVFIHALEYPSILHPENVPLPFLCILYYLATEI